MFFVHRGGRRTRGSLRLRGPGPVFVGHELLSIAIFLTLVLASLLTKHRGCRIAQGRVATSLGRTLTLALLRGGRPVIARSAVQTCGRLQHASNKRMLVTISSRQFYQRLGGQQLGRASFLAFSIISGRCRNNSASRRTVCDSALVVEGKRTNRALTLGNCAHLSTTTMFNVSSRHLPTKLVTTTVL